MKSSTDRTFESIHFFSFRVIELSIIDWSLWNWHILKIEIRLIRFQLYKTKEYLPNVLQLLYRFQTETRVLTSWKSATIDSTLPVSSSFGASSSSYKTITRRIRLKSPLPDLVCSFGLLSCWIYHSPVRFETKGRRSRSFALAHERTSYGRIDARISRQVR